MNGTRADVVTEPLTQTLELLSWLSARVRTYDDTIAVWQSHCPRLTVWEDALSEGLIRVVRAVDGESTVALTERGRATLARADRFR